MGELHGVDVEATAWRIWAPLILSGGYVHPSAVQAVGMLGLGRGSIRRLARTTSGGLTSRRSSAS